MTATACPLCRVVRRDDPRPLHAEGPLTIAFDDAHPSAEGHTLIVPRRHVGHLTDLTDDEHHQLFQALRGQLRRLETEHGTVDHTIGVNDGPAAGQTVAHVHLHIIPRHHGDVADPRGGIRGVLPDTARYWET